MVLLGTEYYSGRRYLCQQCNTPLETRICKSNDNGNAGRLFISCTWPNPQRNGGYCKFFQFIGPQVSQIDHALCGLAEHVAQSTGLSSGDANKMLSEDSDAAEQSLENLQEHLGYTTGLAAPSPSSLRMEPLAEATYSMALAFPSSLLRKIMMDSGSSEGAFPDRVTSTGCKRSIFCLRRDA